MPEGLGSSALVVNPRLQRRTELPAADSLQRRPPQQAGHALAAEVDGLSNQLGSDVREQRGCLMETK
jgi:hypothetical protein